MFYTLTTRTRKHGIWFEPHELEPIGITEGSRCWGAWVEANEWDKLTRLDDVQDTRWVDRQSLHLVVSQTHPDSWPTAFNVQILLQRRSIPEGADASKIDSLVGVTDALRRCGVNILFVRTAQLAYKMLSFSATCEFPDLARVAEDIVRNSDTASKRLHDARTEFLRSRNDKNSPPDQTALAEQKLRECERQAYAARLVGFRKLGDLIMPRLASLEARLILIDHARYRWSKFESERDEQLQQCACDSMYELVVGKAPSPTASGTQRLAEYKAALEQPWYLYTKSVCIGDNSYFLNYDSFASSQAAVSQKAGTTTAREDGHVPAPLSQPAGNASTQASNLSPILQRRLYDAVHRILQSRTVDEFHDGLFAETPLLDVLRGQEPITPAAAQWAQQFSNGDAFARSCLEECFSRHAFRTITCSAIPYLAHARLWAEHGDSEKFEPFMFVFQDNQLRSDVPALVPGNAMEKVYRFLNDAAGLPILNEKKQPVDASDDFRQHAAVIVNLDLDSQCARLRFVRSSNEDSGYAIVRIEYNVREEDLNTREAQGLLHLCVVTMTRKGFRVERASNRPYLFLQYRGDRNVKSGRGYITLTLKAVSESSRKLVQKYRDSPDTSSREEVRTALHNAITEKWKHVGEAQIIDLRLQCGFVPPDR